MAAQPEVPLEEITWRSPQHVQMMGGYLHSNNILFYFAESPFFDKTSNNASLAVQASYNENFRHFLETREAFEGRLKGMQGLEFMVVHDPLQEAAAAGGIQQQRVQQEPSNVWVIRKQMRKKRAGLGSGPAGSDDEIQVLATYFVVGDSVYMAPSVLKIVGSRILSTVTSLTKALSAASPLPIFSPSYGHTYMPPVPKALESSRPGVQQSDQQSVADTPMPDALLQSKDASALSSTAEQPSASTSVSPLTSSSTTMQDSRSLIEAFNLLSRYGDEYMDDAPLLGEPGSFIIGKTSTEPLVVGMRQPVNSEASKAPTPAPSTGVGGSMSKPGTPAATGTTTALSAIKTDPATIGVGKTGKGGEKSPTTPGGMKERTKRRKSKILSTAVVSSATGPGAGVS
ncbi:RNA polymerase II transcription mediator complex subunit [Histoplasma capsulatum var. duboisii H88]|uniref:Mediator of RNA polymerase II transcription subunit 6 n=2 Tax=Ajellomyces capsulatus TaxID=5037 RepID=F0UR85_AJEC8|nr:RNA polymerase II transcription mediator complex subunit [Histoplasma capsulatum H143]EGC48412.1 RNA polymerase II transcription mediator complex subunit [Histoplasma capsulatum var. duboisii H88]QSS50431.1 RNA polymerase II transcription mediator complex subunit [Histoplasma capsulatum var. duboisii H88]